MRYTSCWMRSTMMRFSASIRARHRSRSPGAKGTASRAARAAISAATTVTWHSSTFSRTKYWASAPCTSCVGSQHGKSPEPPRAPSRSRPLALTRSCRWSRPGSALVAAVAVAGWGGRAGGERAASDGSASEALLGSSRGSRSRLIRVSRPGGAWKVWASPARGEGGHFLPLFLSEKKKTKTRPTAWGG